ncbi:MAG: hypothetical protein JWM57_379 [Phycisphaerales bacterium]|nr:hypothetical protein [Phycisphaerales bacterium]
MHDASDAAPCDRGRGQTATPIPPSRRASDIVPNGLCVSAKISTNAIDFYDG